MLVVLSTCYYCCDPLYVSENWARETLTDLFSKCNVSCEDQILAKHTP